MMRIKFKRSKVDLHGAGAYCGGLPHSLLTLFDRIAKEKKLRLWKNYQPATSALTVVEKSYMAKV